MRLCFVVTLLLTLSGSADRILCASESEFEPSPYGATATGKITTSLALKNKFASDVFQTGLTVKLARIEDLWVRAREINPGTVPPFPGPTGVGVSCNRRAGVFQRGLYDHYARPDGSSPAPSVGLSKKYWCGTGFTGPIPADRKAIRAITTIVHENKHCRQKSTLKYEEVRNCPPLSYGHNYYFSDVKAFLTYGLKDWSEKDAYITEAWAVVCNVLAQGPNSFSAVAGKLVYEAIMRKFAEYCAEFDDHIEDLDEAITRLETAAGGQDPWVKKAKKSRKLLKDRAKVTGHHALVVRAFAANAF